MPVPAVPESQAQGLFPSGVVRRPIEEHLPIQDEATVGVVNGKVQIMGDGQNRRLTLLMDLVEHTEHGLLSFCIHTRIRLIQKQQFCTFR